MLARSPRRDAVNVPRRSAPQRTVLMAAYPEQRAFHKALIAASPMKQATKDG